MLGFLPFKTSYGVWSVKAFVPTRLIRYVAWRTASPHRWSGKDTCFNRLLVISKRVLFLLSTIPFCCGEYGAVKCLTIPDLSQNSLNSVDVNSPPLSVRKHLIFAFVSSSTTALNFWNLSNASPFPFRRMDHMYLEWSSIMTRMYRFLAVVGGEIGPHRSPWMSSKMCSAR